MHSPVALLTQQNQIRRLVRATRSEWTDMVDRRRPINRCATSLTHATISVMHIFPKPLPVLLIGVISHPHIAKKLIVGLGPLSGLHRHHPAVVHRFHYPKVDLVIMIVVCHNDRAVISMVIRITNPN